MRANSFSTGWEAVEATPCAAEATPTPLGRILQAAGVAQTSESADLQSKIKNQKSKIRAPAFTLLELLTVIAIIGILAAIMGPSLSNFKPNAVAAATEQMLTEVGQARQLAMSKHQTVYMVFVPPGLGTDPAFQYLLGGQEVYEAPEETCSKLRKYFE